MKVKDIYKYCDNISSVIDMLSHITDGDESGNGAEAMSNLAEIREALYKHRDKLMLRTELQKIKNKQLPP